MKNILFFSKWKLQWKFLFIFLVLVLLPMLVFSLYIYSQANHAVQHQAVSDVKSHMDKLDQNLMSAIQAIEDISAYMIYNQDTRSYFKASNPTTIHQLEERINGFSTFYLSSNPFINSISLYGLNGNTIEIGIPLGKNAEEKWKDKAKELDGKVYWTDAYPIKDHWGREGRVISLFRMINDINDFSPLGIVAIRLDVEKLYNSMEPDIKNLDEVIIANENGDVLLHQNRNLIGYTYPDEKIGIAIKNSNNQSVLLDYQKNNKQYHAVIHKVKDTNIVLIGIVDKATVAEGISPIQESIKIMVVVLTIFGLLAMLGFYYFNIRRIKELAIQTKQVEKGDFSAKVLVASNDEIGLLGQNFNKMVTRLKHLIENEYQLEIRNRDSELKLLQSQINPHFLYNTLDMIRWTARIEKANETSRLIEQLSKMFRISLNHGKPWLSLKDELAYSQSYLELQKQRLGDKLKYTLYCDHSVLEGVVLKQTIQPLIENSLHHGFENYRSVREIYIRCFKEQDMLIIDVIDNGKGFENNHFETVAKKGFALQNIQSRLNMAFGEQASIGIIQHNRTGAWIRIIHPYKHSHFVSNT